MFGVKYKIIHDIIKKDELTKVILEFTQEIKLHKDHRTFIKNNFFPIEVTTYFHEKKNLAKKKDSCEKNDKIKKIKKEAKWLYKKTEINVHNRKGDSENQIIDFEKYIKLDSNFNPNKLCLYLKNNIIEINPVFINEILLSHLIFDLVILFNDRNINKIKIFVIDQKFKEKILDLQ